MKGFGRIEGSKTNVRGGEYKQVFCGHTVWCSGRSERPTVISGDRQLWPGTKEAHLWSGQSAPPGSTEDVLRRGEPGTAPTSRLFSTAERAGVRFAGGRPCVGAARRSPHLPPARESSATEPRRDRDRRKRATHQSGRGRRDRLLGKLGVQPGPIRSSLQRPNTPRWHCLRPGPGEAAIGARGDQCSAGEERTAESHDGWRTESVRWQVRRWESGSACGLPHRVLCHVTTGTRRMLRCGPRLDGGWNAKRSATGPRRGGGGIDADWSRSRWSRRR